MKNASDIITSIQYKPQFRKILHHKCITKLISIVLPTLRRSIKHGYIHKNIFYITISASLNKYDKDNIIKTIKMVLNSKMILESEQFFECIDIAIEDIVIYVDHKPKIDTKLFHTNTHKLSYHERASGDFTINIQDNKLSSVMHEIQNIIKNELHET